MIAIVADYCVKSRHCVQVVECVKDAKAAIAWVRENAVRLAVDPDKIVDSGGSAGGHLAASRERRRRETQTGCMTRAKSCTIGSCR
jgi:acetyl esterase/lipase